MTPGAPHLTEPEIALLLQIVARGPNRIFFESPGLQKTLRSLAAYGLIHRTANGWKITPQGRTIAQTYPR